MNQRPLGPELRTEHFVKLGNLKYIVVLCVSERDTVLYFLAFFGIFLYRS